MISRTSGTGETKKTKTRGFIHPPALPSRKNLHTVSNLTNRRQFLSRFTGFGAVAALAPDALLAEVFQSKQRQRLQLRLIPLEEVNFNFFQRHLYTPFTVYADIATAVEMELIEAVPAPRPYGQALRAPDAHNEKFSLIFRGPSDRVLPQAMYLVEQSDTGRFGIFIVPILRPDGEFCYYQSIFNRPRGRGKPIVTTPNSAVPEISNH